MAEAEPSTISPLGSAGAGLLAILIPLVFLAFVWFCGKCSEWITRDQIRAWERENGKAFGDFDEEYKRR
jgi:hypothetical protein